MSKELLTYQSLATGRAQTLVLRAPRLSIAFLADGTLEQDYPVYNLRSTDSVYRETLTPKDDLETIDGVRQLRFRDLHPRKNYTLTVTHAPGIVEEVFHGLPYDEVADQGRDYHEPLVDNAFTEMDIDEDNEVSFSVWEAGE